MSKQRNWFAIWVTAAVAVAIIAVTAIVVVANNEASSPGTPPQSEIIDGETGAITFGDGEHVLDTYIDFLCPACGNFEDAYGPDIRQGITDGKITMNVHPISILDRASSGTKFSTRSASAMYCVAENDPDAALTYLQMLYMNQPEEGSTGLTNDDLIRFAQQSAATNSDDCIADEKYTKYVSAMTERTPIPEGSSSISTPTILLDGDFIKLTGDVQADLLSKIN